MKIAGAFVKRRNVVRSIFFSHKNPPTFQVRQNHLHRPLDGTQIFRDDIQRGTAKCKRNGQPTQLRSATQDIATRLRLWVTRHEATETTLWVLHGLAPAGENVRTPSACKHALAREAVVERGVDER